MDRVLKSWAIIKEANSRYWQENGNEAKHILEINRRFWEKSRSFENIRQSYDLKQKA